MKLRYPRYFRPFRCAAGECPDTCCRDWEVVLDEETAARYRAEAGPLGKTLRAAMEEADGETCFRLRQGLCPLLDERGLCRIQLELGEAALSRSCRLHPRFAEEYGALREWSLSMACPEAVRLLLADPAPMALEEETTDEPVTGCNDLDARLFYHLLEARRAAFACCQDRRLPWQQRLGRLLAFAAALQRNLDRHRPGRLPETTARFAQGRLRPLPVGTDPQGGTALLARLRGLEPINSRWQALLAEALAAPAGGEDRRRFAEAARAWEYEYEHLLHYYLYRYFLKAAVDRRLLPRMQLAAFGVLCVRELELARFCAGGLDEAGRVDVIHRFSREVEHSEDNLGRLLVRFAADPALSPEALAASAW